MQSPMSPQIPSTVGEVIAASARRHGRLPALRDRHGTVSYAQMLDRSARLANLLRHHGIADGDRVAILTEDNAWGVIAYVGTWLAGGCAVSVNSRFTAEEVGYILEDAEATGVLYSPGLAGRVEGRSAPDDMRIALEIDPAANSRFSRLLGEGSTTPPALTVGAEDIALLGYTSGTSGRPKGAMLSHGAVAMSARAWGQFFGTPAKGRLAFTGSFSFPASMIAQILTHLYLGGMAHILGPYDADRWFSVMREDRTTFTYLPSPLAPEFVDRLNAEPGLLDHLQMVMHGGSPLLRPQLEAVVEATRGKFREVYGMTEMCGVVSATAPWMYAHGSDAEDLLSSVGQNTPTVEVWIERPDGTRADVGEVGEIVTDGDTRFSGYWNDPGKTAEAMAGGGFHTGDLGRLDEAGFLYISGRRTELIISGGMNVYPAEVENVLLEHPAIARAAVFGVPHPRWGEGVAAAIELRPGTSLDEAAVLEHCRAKLAGYKKPTSIYLLDAMPLNSSLKVDKLELRKRYGAGSA